MSEKDSENVFHSAIDPISSTGDNAELLAIKTQPARPKRSNNFFSRTSSIAIAATIFILYVTFRHVPSGCYGLLSPIYPGPAKWSDFRNESFAVGIDLTAGYGTAAVSFVNGIVLDIGRVNGTADYIEVMARLSLKGSAHPTPPYYHCDNQSNEFKLQWTRFLRKKRGLPSSPEVAALVTVLQPLKDQVDRFLHASNDLSRTASIQTTFITAPWLPALYTEDLFDAAQYVGLQLLAIPPDVYMPSGAAMQPVTEINTALAGHGCGLVVEGRKLNPACRYDKFRSEHVLSVLFTKHALTAHIGPFRWAVHFYDLTGMVDFGLGYGSKRNGTESYEHDDSDNDLADDEEEEKYWSKVRALLQKALRSNPTRSQSLGLVLSHGEAATNPTFQQILKDEVISYQIAAGSGAAVVTASYPASPPYVVSSEDNKNNVVVVFITDNPIFAAARGAAEFGRMCLPRPDGFEGTFSDECFPDLRPQIRRVI